MIGHSSAHAPFEPTNRALISFNNVQFITLVCPLFRGCPRDEYLFLMLRLDRRTDDHYQRQLLVGS